MTGLKMLAAGWLAAAAICLAAPLSATAANYGDTAETLHLKALLDENAGLDSALLVSLKAADWNGITTLDQFFDFVDETVRMVPTERNGLAEIRPFFYMIGQSPTLRSSPAFQAWVTSYVTTWGDFLDTTASVAGLDTFLKDPAFRMEQYYVAPSGWLTFNQFFARNVKPGMRPIAGIGDDVTVVAPADGILETVLPVDAQSMVTAKGISYSIADLLAGSKYADDFAGGTFVHSFQEVTDYHHFHVPVAGRVVEKRNIAAPIWLDVKKDADGALHVVDGTGFQWRQERGMLVMETEELGLVAILPIGMGHVGGVVMTPDVGAELYKGEQFGFFQFGGSDVVTVFQKDRVKITGEIGKHYLQGEALGMRADAPE